MRFRALLLLGLALVFGGLAAFMVNRIVSQQDAPEQAQADPAAPGTAVVVAASEIPRGEELTANMLRLVELPRGTFPENAFRSIDDVLEDSPVRAVNNIYENELILPRRLSTGMDARGISSRIPEGYRAIAITMNAVRGVSGFVFPGDRVDVLHTTSVGRLDEEPVTRTLLQDVTVLSVNQVASEPEEGAMVATVVNLLASPDDAKTLTLAQQVGQLTMALRNELDDEVLDRQQVNTISLRDLWVLSPREQAAAEEAARRRAEEAAREAARRPVGIIRGLEIHEEIMSPNEGSPAAAGRSN